METTDPAIRSVERGGSIVAGQRFMQERRRPLEEKLSLALDELFDHELSRFGAAREMVSASAEKVTRSLILAALLTGIGFLATIFLLARLTEANYHQELLRESLYLETRRVAQARQEALETVSHDLKNPLTAIELNLGLMERRRAQGQLNSEKQIQGCLRAVASMKELILQLLDQAKLEAGSLGLNLQSNDLLPVIERSRDVLEPLATQKGIRVQVRAEPGLPPFPFDAIRMGQVVGNILGNAIKFTPEGGNIHIAVAHEDDRVRVAISDSGPGMTEDQCAHVFERFWQAKATHRLGTGLGLSIAKAVIDAHGGTISARSLPGEGTTFEFSLPSGARVGLRAGLGSSTSSRQVRA